MTNPLVRDGAGRVSSAVFLPLAGVVARSLANTRVTPNALSLLNAAFGVAGGFVAYYSLTRGRGAFIAVAFALWFAGYICDCADGQLARLTGQGSSRGAVVDVCCDYVVQGALYGSIAAALVAEDKLPVFAALWVLWAGAAGLFMASVQNLGGAGLTERDGGTAPSLLVGFVRLTQDYGAHLVVLAFTAVFIPSLFVAVVVLIAAINSGAYVARLLIMSVRG